MGGYLAALMQILVLVCGPLVGFGLVVFLCRQLFVALVGTRAGRPFLLVAFALSTPLRELGHAFMAVICCHAVEDVKLLDLHALDGELGYVEHSYNPKNPIALLGNFLYALGPLVFGMLAVYLIFLLSFGNAISELSGTVAALGDGGGDLSDYLSAAAGLLPAMGRGGISFGKIVGGLLLLLLCMGAFVSVQELIDGFSGFLIFSGISALFTAVLLLFDARVQRLVLDALRSYAAVVTALNLALLLALAALLLLAAVWFLYRFLFLDERTDTALVPYEEKK